MTNTWLAGDADRDHLMPSIFWQTRDERLGWAWAKHSFCAHSVLKRIGRELALPGSHHRCC